MNSQSAVTRVSAMGPALNASGHGGWNHEPRTAWNSCGRDWVVAPSRTMRPRNIPPGRNDSATVAGASSTTTVASAKNAASAGNALVRLVFLDGFLQVWTEYEPAATAGKTNLPLSSVTATAVSKFRSTGVWTAKSGIRCTA